MDIKCNQQVVWKQSLQNGLKIVKVGTVLAFSADNETATVSFPAEHMRRQVPVSQLSPAQDVYGRSRVEVDPSRRLVNFLR